MEQFGATDEDDVEFSGDVQPSPIHHDTQTITATNESAPNNNDNDDDIQYEPSNEDIPVPSSPAPVVELSTLTSLLLTPEQPSTEFILHSDELRDTTIESHEPTTTTTPITPTNTNTTTNNTNTPLHCLNRYLLLNSEPISISFSGYKVWYDEACSMLILVRRGEFRCVALTSTSTPILRFKYDRPALDVKVSLDMRWVAIQQSDTSVALLKPSELRMWSLECSEKRLGNLVLRGGSVWLGSGAECCLTLVTRFGLECHMVPSEISSNNNNNTRTNSLKARVENVDCFWSLSAKSLVLLSCGELGREMRPFFLGELPTRFVKWPKFMLRSSPSPGDVALVQLYNEAWIVCVFPGSVSLHRVSSEANSYVERVVQFGSRIPIQICGISTIDSLLFLHAKESNVSMMIDVGQQAPDEIFAHPLPLGGLLMPDDPYGPSCVFLPPYWVLDAKLGKVWQLEVNLKCAAKCARANPSNMALVSEFLLRRTCRIPTALKELDMTTMELQDEVACYGKAVFLSLLYETVLAEEMSIVDVDKWFAPCVKAWALKPGPRRLFNEKDQASQAALLDSVGLKDVRALDGSALVFQFDVYRKVLLPCLSLVDTRPTAQFPGWLAAVCLEFAKSMASVQAVEPYVYELAFRMLVKAGRGREIHQLALYKVPCDSPSLAEVLMTCGDGPAAQVGWDMLKRLGLIEHLCLRLLENGQVFAALYSVMDHIDRFAGGKMKNNIVELFVKAAKENDEMKPMIQGMFMELRRMGGEDGSMVV